MPNTDSFDVIEATVEEIHAAIESREVTAESLVDSYLSRIDKYDDDLHSILTVNPDAPQRAKQLDSQFDTNGFVGPLHGVPIILKDNQDTHDMPTTAGSVALAGAVPSQDAYIVKRLRDAGGVILAKANLQEFSYGVDTISSLGGETRNAYALDRRPSGSSGGTAAAIAANLGMIGTGSDTCSSVRSPPALNNLVGLRPTRGLVSRTGIIPLSETQDTAGPITRTVTDAARMLDVLSGYDPADPITAQSVGKVPDDGYTSHLDEHGLSGARIGVVREFFGLQNKESSSEAAAKKVTTIIETAIDEMEAAGATIIDPIEIIDTEFLASARVIHYEFKRDFNQYLEELADGVPYRTLGEIIDTGQVAEAVQSRIESNGLLDIDLETLNENIEYLQRLERRHHIKVDTVRRLVDNDLDALLYPPSTIPPVKLPYKQPFDELPCELAAHTGLPSIVMQAGFTNDGLPVGIELLGRAFAEPRLFELAYSYEQETNHRQPPDGFGEIA